MESKDDDSLNSSDLQSNGIHQIGDIDDINCAEAVKFILEANLTENPAYDHLILIINSNGGSVTDGFSLIDVMQGSRIPVYTVGIGMLASMGLLIFMAGKKGHRVLTPNTLILSHQWWSISYGKEHELLATRKKNDLISSMVMKHYQKYTGLKEKQIRKILLPESDVWLSANEAQTYGLCDQIKLL